MLRIFIYYVGMRVASTVRFASNRLYKANVIKRNYTPLHHPQSPPSSSASSTTSQPTTPSQPTTQAQPTSLQQSVPESGQEQQLQHYAQQNYEHTQQFQQQPYQQIQQQIQHQSQPPPNAGIIIFLNFEF